MPMTIWKYSTAPYVPSRFNLHTYRSFRWHCLWTRVYTLLVLRRSCLSPGIFALPRSLLDSSSPRAVPTLYAWSFGSRFRHFSLCRSRTRGPGNVEKYWRKMARNGKGSRGALDPEYHSTSSSVATRCSVPELAMSRYLGLLDINIWARKSDY